MALEWGLVGQGMWSTLLCLAGTTVARGSGSAGCDGGRSTFFLLGYCAWVYWLNTCKFKQLYRTHSRQIVICKAIFTGGAGLHAMFTPSGKKAMFCHLQVNWTSQWRNQFITMINNKELWAMELQTKTNLWKLLSKWLWLMWFAFGQFTNQKLNVWNETFIIHYSLSIGNGICIEAEPIHFMHVSGVYYTKNYMGFFFLKKKRSKYPS